MRQWRTPRRPHRSLRGAAKAGLAVCFGTRLAHVKPDSACCPPRQWFSHEVRIDGLRPNALIKVCESRAQSDENGSLGSVRPAVTWPNVADHGHSPGWFTQTVGRWCHHRGPGGNHRPGLGQGGVGGGGGRSRVGPQPPVTRWGIGGHHHRRHRGGPPCAASLHRSRTGPGRHIAVAGGQVRHRPGY